jgi:hypothetical protein
LGKGRLHPCGQHRQQHEDRSCFFHNNKNWIRYRQKTMRLPMAESMESRIFTRAGANVIRCGGLAVRVPERERERERERE